MPTILLLEDEPAIADAVEFSLQAEGWQVIWCPLIAAAEPVWPQADLLLLDVGLPDGSGFSFCQQVRKTSEVPVLFLTARHDEIDRVVGLELGADDYIVKPFSPRELVARVRANLKRWQRPEPMPLATETSSPSASAETAVRVGDFEWQAAACRVLLAQQRLELTALEYRLLVLFLSKPQQVCSREQLLAAGGQAVSAGYERNIDTHIKSIRAKCKAVSDKGYIQTVRGFGYRFEPMGLIDVDPEAHPRG